ncbi:hypothetical protein O181_131263 [Austropuccinia psidii MF-1]|uniref:Uncharacterized protein n=1 Tax=Austropuccinia psidii MF-1 TaxID=1389203 RepID=A0A9Q3L1K8_9BASI|nr:hypothetical protein [Austropuccinia psidii MF-1]
MAIEDQGKWLALELSGMNKEDQVKIPQKKFKTDLKLPEANSSGIEEYYFNIFQEEAWYISDTDKDLLSEELKDNIINPVVKRKFQDLEKESSIITEDKMDQVSDRNIQRRIEKKKETVESEDDLKSYQQKNGDLEDKYKQEGIFEYLEEGELSENSKRLAGLSILEELNDAYDKICFLSRSIDLFHQNQGITLGLPNDFQNQNGIQKDIPEYEGL